jgi:hypothetical protein
LMKARTSARVLRSNWMNPRATATEPGLETSQNWWVVRILRLNQLKLHIRAAGPRQKGVAISDTSVDSTRINILLIFHWDKVFCLWFPRCSYEILFGISRNCRFSSRHRKGFEFAELLGRTNFEITRISIQPHSFDITGLYRKNQYFGITRLFRNNGVISKSF